MLNFSYNGCQPLRHYPKPWLHFGPGHTKYEQYEERHPTWPGLSARLVFRSVGTITSMPNRYTPSNELQRIPGLLKTGYEDFTQIVLANAGWDN